MGYTMLFKYRSFRLRGPTARYACMHAQLRRGIHPPSAHACTLHAFLVSKRTTFFMQVHSRSESFLSKIPVMIRVFHFSTCPVCFPFCYPAFVRLSDGRLCLYPLLDNQIPDILLPGESYSRTSTYQIQLRPSSSPHYGRLLLPHPPRQPPHPLRNRSYLLSQPNQTLRLHSPYRLSLRWLPRRDVPRLSTWHRSCCCVD